MSEFIEWSEIEPLFKKSRGKEKVRCPKCDASRSDKKDRSLQINHNDGFGKCHYCDALAFIPKENEDRKEYTKLKPLPITSLSEKMVQWVKDTRGISESTLSRFNITEEKIYQPAKQKEMNSITFNYFEGAKLVNKKFRSASKDFTQTAGGKPIFYNINSAVGSDKVYIVEGEFDVLAMYEVGVKSCISLPNGANDNDEFWINSEKYLKDVSQFVIATDNDEKGLIVRDKIAQRLGRYRCSYVDFKHKDANGDLINKCLKQTLDTVKRFPVSGTFTVEDLHGEILELYDNGTPATIGFKDPVWKGFNDVFTVMTGHLVTGTGIPSHGKSTFLEFYVLNLIKDHSMKASFFSPEHSPLEMHQANFIQKAVGKTFFQTNNYARVSKTEIEQYKNWANEKLYLTATSPEEKPTWSWLFAKFKEQIYSFGIDIFVIDAFNKLLFDKGDGGKGSIDQVLTELTSFAQTNNVIIFLVAHPTKMKKEEKTGEYAIPTLYDCSGSSDFRNQTHDGFAIHRFFNNDGGYTKFVNLKTKMQFQGKIGESIDLMYDMQSGRYYPMGTQPDRSNYTESAQLHQVNAFAKLEPSSDFDNQIDDCPF